MNPTLANFLGAICAIVFLLGLFKLVMDIIEKFKTKPAAHEQFVKIPTCKEHREACAAALEKRLEKIDGELSTIDQGDRRGRSDIHRDVRKLEERLGKTEAYVEVMNQRQISQGGILDNILSEQGELKGLLKAKT